MNASQLLALDKKGGDLERALDTAIVTTDKARDAIKLEKNKGQKG